MARISFIAAVAENYVIGKEGQLPWRLPADLKWFVEHTRGKPVLFGRRTFESTGYLKARRNIVLTTRRDYDGGADVVVHTLDEALAEAEGDDELMVLGGATIYEELLPRADRFYLTVVHARPDGDTRFPPFSEQQWDVVYEERRDADERNPHAMTFYILDRAEYGPSDAAPTELLPVRYR